MKAWLITWGGSGAKFNGRCKVVAVLPPMLNEKSIEGILPILFYSECNASLSEKMGVFAPKTEDPLLKKWHGEEFTYGDGQEFLYARKVKHLRCEQGREDSETMRWTELSKTARRLSESEESSYTYSNRAGSLFPQLWLS